MSRFARVAALPALGVAVLGIAGCSMVVEQDALEKQVSSSLSQQTGVEPKSVDCPDDLDGEVDATTKCTLTAPTGDEVGATVTVTEVEGENVKFDIEVDQAGQGGGQGRGDNQGR